MKKFFIVSASTFFIFILFAHANAELGSRLNTPTQKAVNPPQALPVPINQINSIRKNVQLSFQGVPLVDVLQSISDESGIKVILTSTFKTVPVNANIQANNWETAIKKLVDNYSRIEVWTDDPKTSRVWLMDDSEDGPKISNIIQGGFNEPNRFKKNKVSAPYNSSQAEKITRVDTMIPPHILFDPGLLFYLESVGVELPKSMESIYRPMMEGLSPDTPISPTVLRDPSFRRYLEYLKLQGIEPPQEL
jgi:hypothetical protein